MEKEYQFQVSITDQNRIDFAELSGDFNPLHIDQYMLHQLSIVNVSCMVLFLLVFSQD